MDVLKTKPAIDDAENRKLRNKLTRVISKAGLSWVTYSSIVDFAEELPGKLTTACWIFDRVSKKEKILFHKKMLAEWPVPLLVLVLRHEFLHKSMYRNIRGATNHALINFALDAAINKILFLSQPRGMVKLTRMLFPCDRTNITCVMNSSISMIERNKMDSRIRRIFDDIYVTKATHKEYTKSGNIMYTDVEITCGDVFDSPYLFNKDIPDPLMLYNKLSALLSPEQKQKIEEMYEWIKSGGRGGSQNTSAPSPNLQNNKSGKPDKFNDLVNDSQKKEEEKKEKPQEDQENQDDNNDQNEDQVDDQTNNNQVENHEDNQDDNDSEANNKDNIGDQHPTASDVSNDDPHENVNPDDFGSRILARGGSDGLRNNSKQTINAEAKVAEKLCAETYSNHANLDAYFETHIYLQKDSDTNNLKDFIAKWETNKQIESVTSKIYDCLRSKPSIDPIPYNLSRTGFELVVLDVCGPDQIPIYFNNENIGIKKKICCYFDTSPSMHAFIPYMITIADFFNSCEECEITGGKYNGRYCFSEKVEGIKDWEAFIKGEVQGGFGTSFEIVVKHATDVINEDEIDIIVVFTDGLSGINKNTIEEFNKTNKKCYTVYFNDPNLHYSWFHSRKGEQKTEFTPMHSDLDKLNGDNFTIFVDTSRKEE